MGILFLPLLLSVIVPGSRTLKVEPLVKADLAMELSESAFLHPNAVHVMCMCMRECVCHQRPEEGARSSGTGLQVAVSHLI